MSDQPVATTEAENNASCPNSVLGKTFAILSAFNAEDHTVRLIELSRRTGISKPSVYRLAQELVELGLLARCPGGYQLGGELFALGQRVTSAPHLRSAARPVLVDLCAAARAPIHLAVLEHGQVQYLDKLAGTRNVHVLVPDDTAFPATSTASGKLLLAYSHDADSFTRLTPQLREELAAVRERRFATERGHVNPGIKAFAVGITDPAGECVAALAAAVPVDHQADRELLNLLWAAAANISREYGRRLLRGGSSPAPRPPVRAQRATA